MLQKSGAISLGDIRKEFGGGNPSSLGEYYLNGANGLVKANTNGKIPKSGVNKFSNYYGASDFLLQIKFFATSESTSKYSNKDNGSIGIYLTGVSNNWQISCTGEATKNVGSSGKTTTFGSLNSGSYTVTVKDVTFKDSWSFSFKIHLGGTSTVSGYSLNKLYSLSL